MGVLNHDHQDQMHTFGYANLSCVSDIVLIDSDYNYEYRYVSFFYYSNLYATHLIKVQFDMLLIVLGLRDSEH